MRSRFPAIVFGLLLAFSSSSSASAQDTEWTDLFANRLKDWSRFGDGASPWHFTEEGILKGDRGPEVIIPEREFRDGTLRFEYRFRSNDKESGYKAAVWVRRTQQERGCKIALGDDCGMLTAVVQGGSDRVKVIEQKPAIKVAREPGYWNLVSIRLDGKSVKVWINSRQVCSFSDCETDKGLFGLELEGSEIEFRRVMWKESK